MYTFVSIVNKCGFGYSMFPCIRDRGKEVERVGVRLTWLSCVFCLARIISLAVIQVPFVIYFQFSISF